LTARWRKIQNLHHTIEFVNALAFIANREDHHPNLSVNYGMYRAIQHHDVSTVLCQRLCASVGRLLS
jgi:4a-hydroxytetrahydrobiopterin dehydratase